MVQRKSRKYLLKTIINVWVFFIYQLTINTYKHFDYVRLKGWELKLFRISCSKMKESALHKTDPLQLTQKSMKNIFINYLKQSNY